MKVLHVSKTLLLTIIALSFITVLFPITLSAQTTSTKCFVDINYSSLKTNDLIVGVKSFFTLFVWRSKFDNSSSQLLESFEFAQQLGNDQLLSNWINQLSDPLLVGVEYKYFPLFNNLISSLSTINRSKLIIKKIYLTDELCRVSNLYEEFDALFLEPYKFTYFVRIYREQSFKTTKNRKTTASNDDSYINSSEFYPFRMMASNLTIIDRKSCPTDEEVRVDLEKHNNSYFEFVYSLGNYSCQNHPEEHDNQHLRLLSGISNFTQNDMNLLQNVTKTKFQYTTLYLTQIGKLSNTITPTNSSILNQILLPSSCHFCSATLCPEYHINDEEYWSIGQVGVILIYFVVFFISGSFKSKVFTQRLALPYAPIISFLVMIFFSKNVASYCFVAFHLNSLWMCLWFLLLFTFTMARLVYMRNMYKIVKNSSNIKMHKVLASAWFGVIVSLFILPLISILVTFYGVAMFFIDNNSLNLFRNSILLAFLFGGCLLGLVAVFFDMFFNRRNIKGKGILKFLFFDDPYLVRLELLLLVMLMLVGVWSVILSLVDIAQSGRSLNFLVALFTTMACGGNALIVELLKKIIFRKKFSTEKDTLDQLLVVNQDLYDMFKDYCSKEFSLENILFFDKLRQSSSNFSRMEARLSKEMVEEWEKDFFTPYGKYELNIPSHVRKQVVELFNKVKTKGNSTEELLQAEERISISNLHEIVFVDLLLNLNDTFSRLQRTREFQRWKEVYNIQNVNRGVSHSN